MIMIFHDVRTTEKRARKYRHGRHDSLSTHSQSREVAAQALLYSLAYSIPWIWGLILSFINTAVGVFGSAAIDDAITALNIVNVIIFPLQGVSLMGWSNMLLLHKSYYHLLADTSIPLQAFNMKL